MSGLPPGWKMARIGDLIELSPKNSCTDDTDAGFVPLQRLGTTFRAEHSFETKKWREIKKGYTHFANGDVLLARITPSFENGKAGIAKNLPNGVGAGSTEYFVCRPKPGVLLPEYLLAFFKTRDFLQNGEQVMSGAVGQQRVPKQYVLDTQIPLAPLAEQKRIADKLDRLLAAVDTCKARLDAIPAILKRFRQSVLAAATSGELTEEWRRLRRTAPADGAAVLLQTWMTNRRARFAQSGSTKRSFKEAAEPDLAHWDGSVPEGWAVSSVSQFAECLDGLRVPVKKERRARSKGTYPYYGANGQVDSVDGYLFDDELVLVTEDETFYGREKPIAYRVSGKCWVNNHAHVLRAELPEASDYLCYALMYYNVLPWLTGTTGRAKLTQAALNSLPIAVPPLTEQQEIVWKVDTLLSVADQIDEQRKAALCRVEKIIQGVLAKAFRGEWAAAGAFQLTDDVGSGGHQSLRDTSTLERSRKRSVGHAIEAGRGKSR